MNGYTKNINKIEFAVTYACTGRCIHCSVGDRGSACESIDPRLAENAVRGVLAEYDVKTVMAFGGEPLLYPETVYAIMSAATELSVPKRQVITNGAFTADIKKMREVAKGLCECGVNEVLISVDAFHQRTLPLGRVKIFAKELISLGVPARLQPAWLVSREDENPYNKKTREILADISECGLSENEGNIIFPEGNAKIYLSEYFENGAPKNPYEDDPFDVRCVSISPNGDVLGGNLYKQNIIDILDGYSPKIYGGA